MDVTPFVIGLLSTAGLIAAGLDVTPFVIGLLSTAGLIVVGIGIALLFALGFA